MLKFVFEDQDYQKEAIDAVAGIFASMPRDTTDYTHHTGIISNSLLFRVEDIQESLSTLQASLIEKKKIHQKTTIADEGMNFTIEMETGTGKTYVYIRTILELSRLYGWKKFIIIVHSLPIKEGVLKTFETTREHFRSLPDMPEYSWREYDSSKPQILKDYAKSDGVEILIMTTGAFNKDFEEGLSDEDKKKKKGVNSIYQYKDIISELGIESGKAIDLISETKPILILDEPQNMEGEQTKKGLAKLNPLFTLRYSATHREAHNPIYVLGPGDAYRQGLVKQIEVVSVVEDESIGEVEISLISTTSKGQKITASIECFVEKNGLPAKKIINIKSGDDLKEKTGLANYTGWIVDNIGIADNWGNVGFVSFTNGKKISEGSRVGGEKSELLRLQIETAVKNHFEKRHFLRTHNIKPLSLFFIDAVDNYVLDEGVIRKLFIQALEKINTDNGSPIGDIHKAHDGYFSKKKEKGGEEVYIDSKEGGDTKNDKDTYNLIMRDKEKLLSLENPVEFIFSHSALREGWDNPNVFTIATLRERASTISMRQELGRGMRLCVNNKGVRIRTLSDGKNPNILTVVPTMSYKHFAETLQGEYKKEGYDDVPPPKDGRKRETIKRKKNYSSDPLLKILWEKVSKQSVYSISIESQKMIKEIVSRINTFESAHYQKKVFTIGETTLITEIGQETKGNTQKVGARLQKLEKRTLNNPIEEIEKRTGLSRKSIGEILMQVSNRDFYAKNPEKYISDVIAQINQVKDRISVEEIIYHPTGKKYSLDDFAEEIQSYKDRILEVPPEKQEKTLYNGIIYDSPTVELPFAKSLIDSPYIRYFLKLPAWFIIQTPVLGNTTYNPDWAILASRTGTGDDMRLYFIVETKGSTNEDERRGSENQKIHCGKKHFQAIDEDLKYHDLTDFETLKNLIIG